MAMQSCLLVDDDLPLAALLSDYLQGFAFKVETVHTGAAMRERFARGDIDVLLAGLRAAGIEVITKPEWDDPATGRFARIHDPEGNAIELWQPSA